MDNRVGAATGDESGKTTRLSTAGRRPLRGLLAASIRAGLQQVLVIPLHDPVRAKTLSSIPRRIGRYRGIGVQELLRIPDLRWLRCSPRIRIALPHQRRESRK